MKYDLDDIMIVPAVTSGIRSRKTECDIYDKNNMLPIFNAPMDRVINLDNERAFISNKINTVQVRGTFPIDDRTIISKSLAEFVDMIIPDNKEIKFDPNMKYLIDMANGHMEDLLVVVRNFKKIYPDTYLMVGNIANPETYKLLSFAGADAIRISIGTGGSCLTGVHAGIGYPLASLIMECREIKETYNLKTAIIADGGMKNFADMVKSLALGADYIMVGNLFNKAIESAGDNLLYGKFKVPQWLAEWAYLKKIPVYKSMRGMSTKEVQKDWGKKVLTSSEGTVSKNKVEYTLSGFIENFEDYLKSQMSYVGARNLDEFIGKTNYIIVSQNSLKRITK